MKRASSRGRRGERHCRHTFSRSEGVSPKVYVCYQARGRWPSRGSPTSWGRVFSHRYDRVEEYASTLCVERTVLLYVQDNVLGGQTRFTVSLSAISAHCSLYCFLCGIRCDCYCSSICSGAEEVSYSLELSKEEVGALSFPLSSFK